MVDSSHKANNRNMLGYQACLDETYKSNMGKSNSQNGHRERQYQMVPQSQNDVYDEEEERDEQASELQNQQPKRELFKNSRQDDLMQRY